MGIEIEFTLLFICFLLVLILSKLIDIKDKLK